jgi:hypothetical protein
MANLLLVSILQDDKKRFGVLRQAQHERKMLNQFKHHTVRLEALERRTVSFSATC